MLFALLSTASLWQPLFAQVISAPDMRIEGAKKEQKLVFYTTMELPQNIKVINDFMEKYPFLDLEIHPLESETLVERVQSEARNGMSTCDVVLGGGGLFQQLLEANLIAAYHSPQRDAISDALNDSEGYWSGYYVNAYVLGYNTTLVKKDEIPKKYDELLDSRWKGNRIAFDRQAHGLLRVLGAAWGKDKAVGYLTGLADQQPVMARASIAAVDSLHSGNVLMVIAHAPVIHGYKEKLGSSIDWTFLGPIVAQIDAVMLSSQARSPNAARLFVDFLLSREGQSSLASILQIPVRRDMEPVSKSAFKDYRWFVERPDKHVDFQKTVNSFREIFGIQ